MYIDLILQLGLDECAQASSANGDSHAIVTRAGLMHWAGDNKQGYDRIGGSHAIMNACWAAGARGGDDGGGLVHEPC
jgi:hypothetical protein